MQKQFKREEMTFENLWMLFQETGSQIEETGRQMEESKKRMDESFARTEKMIAETNKGLQETKKIVDNLSKKMKESESRWGRFVEALVEGTLIKMLNNFGISVNGTLIREKKMYQDEEYEIDIIAKNGVDIVAVEVKTTLSVQDVNDFLDKLNLFKTIFQDYSHNNLIGAVAYINKDSEADRYAAKKGLIVIKAVGEGAKITNRKGFKPKKW